MQDLNPDYDGWNIPLSLEGVNLSEWPKNVFPEPFNSFVNELSRSTETPIELASMLALSVVATVAQKHFQVCIKKGYSEPLCLWTIGILPPASRKTAVFSAVTRPLKEWEFEQKEQLTPIIESMNSKKKTVEIRIKELRNKAAKVGEGKYDEIQSEIEQLEDEIKDIPTIPQLWTGDITPEHLGTIMSLNYEAMAVLSDEGGIFDILGGLYSEGKANIDLFLQAHAASSVRIDRGSRPAIFMDRPVLTIGLTVQPQIVKTVCNNKTFRGRGLLGRALYIFPKTNIGSRNCNEEPMNEEVQSAYNVFIKTILEFESLNKALISLTLSPDAFKKWQEYSIAVEKLMSEDIGHLSHITDWAGKLPGAIARIAALIHIMRVGKSALNDTLVSLEDMTAAIRIGHALQSHALKTFDLIKEADSLQMARTIYAWVKEGKIEFFTLRDTYRTCTRRYNKEIAVLATAILEEHEIIKAIEPTAGKQGRPSEKFIVNPYVHKGG